MRRLAEASAWRVALSEADALTCEEFEAWIADARNEAAWDRVQDSWTMVGDQARSPELLAMRRDALGRAHERQTARWSRGSWLPRLAACLILVACATLLYTMWPSKGALVYATALGERRVLTLADGSRISLDSLSKVKIDYSENARRLELVGGQARFDVAHDVTRPFSVKARDRLVVATGTAFNIDLIGPETLVTLIEGKVVILDDRKDSKPASLSPSLGEGVKLIAGQQLSAAPSSVARVVPIAVDRATSWESGQLVFEDETIGEIAVRISHYSARPLRVDPAVANQKISGVFNAGDVANFADTVSRYLPVQTVTRADGSLLLKPRS